MKIKCVVLLVIIYSLFPIPHSLLFAESEFSLQLAPVFVSPAGVSQMSPGIGAGASLNWAFWNFTEGFDFGLTAGGGFARLPVQVGEPLMLFEGKAGPFVRWRILDRWAFQIGINAGVYQYSRGEDSDTRGLFDGVLGAQFHVSPYFSLFTEGGFTYRVFASNPLNSINAAIGIRLNLSEIMGGRARVRIDKTQQYHVFPVSWAWYEDNPIAAVTITNNEPNAISDLHLSFFVERYMSQPWVFAFVPGIASGESIEVPVTALFNEALLSLNENVNANGIVQIQYRSLGSRKEAGSAVQMPIFMRNNMSWDDDRRAAAFVSPRDSAARLFARYVASAVDSELRTEGSPAMRNTPSNVLYAAALLETLRLYRISYVVDPSSSYITLSEDESAIDSLNFPYQTLYYRGGDCDDLSILFCSLLEALDIASAFITIPGHIYIAFEVGDNDWQANNPNIIAIDSKRWLPVEITVPGEGFSRAWRIGAQQWRNAGEDAELFPIREAWAIYPPVTAPNSGDHLPEVPEWGEIIRAVTNQLSY